MRRGSGVRFLPFQPPMLQFFPLVMGMASGFLLVRERRARARFERLGGAVFETLLSAIDANDPQTGAHVRRVARYALVLADALGLDERSKRGLERGALFHDIGKIDQALFDILHDASRLTPEERRAVRTHPSRGARVLDPLDAFYPELSRIVIAHHERWDGRGYPRRLRAGRIPLAARIIAIVDAFDAITHRRRYKGAQSVEEAVRAIEEGRGAQFDPSLVDLFLLPPVLERVIQEMHAADRRERHPRPMRRHGGSSPTPDVTFRWRTPTRA
jgi:putative nucleotidyltransferase with HDIG domain